jgi:hypothetical protein
MTRDPLLVKRIMTLMIHDSPKAIEDLLKGCSSTAGTWLSQAEQGQVLPHSRSIGGEDDEVSRFRLRA